MHDLDPFAGNAETATRETFFVLFTRPPVITTENFIVKGRNAKRATNSAPGRKGNWIRIRLGENWRRKPVNVFLFIVAVLRILEHREPPLLIVDPVFDAEIESESTKR
jgi:hypothetical protein